MFEGTVRTKDSMKVGETHTFEFPYSGLTIVNLVASCGCTEVENKNGVVKGTYKAGKIPEHMRRAGVREQITQKYIYVDYYIDDPKKVEKVTLTFHTIVKE